MRRILAFAWISWFSVEATSFFRIACLFSECFAVNVKYQTRRFGEAHVVPRSCNYCVVKTHKSCHCQERNGGGEGDKGLSPIVDQGEKTLTLRCRGDMSHSCPRLALVQLYSVPVPRWTSTLDTQLSRQLVTRGLPPTKNLFGFANIDVCMWKKAVNIQLVDLFVSHLGKTWCYVMSKFIHNTFVWNNSHKPKKLHVSPVHGNIRIVLLDDFLLT